MPLAGHSATRRRPRRGRPRAAEVSARIDQLLDIALRLFTERGYNGTSVGEIARRADASKQTLYARFPTKARLFDEVMRRRGAARDLLFARILASDADIRVVLDRFAEALAAVGLDDKARSLARTMIGESKAFPQLARHYWAFGPQHTLVMLADYMDRQIRAGVLARRRPGLLAGIFYALCVGRFYQKSVLGIMDRADRAEYSHYVREAVRVFLAAYRDPRHRGTGRRARGSAG